MQKQLLELLPRFLERLGLDEEPMGVFYTDELSFTVPFQMFNDMLSRFDDSFLKTDSWATVQKKIQRSKKTGGKFRCWSLVPPAPDQVD